MDAGPLPEEEYHRIYARVPRLTVELFVQTDDGIVLTQRTAGPCAGLWHLPGGTVRYGEALTDAVARVGLDELGVGVLCGELLGVIEYPSHVAAGIDSPVGLVFDCQLAGTRPPAARVVRRDNVVDQTLALHDEQRTFILDALATAS
jgi:ADP-ribose pyrophosphatase YjhB (NUDIX family)